jgi:hypothetical protein
MHVRRERVSIVMKTLNYSILQDINDAEGGAQRAGRRRAWASGGKEVIRKDLNADPDHDPRVDDGSGVETPGETGV